MFLQTRALSVFDACWLNAGILMPRLPLPNVMISRFVCFTPLVHLYMQSSFLRPESMVFVLRSLRW